MISLPKDILVEVVQNARKRDFNDFGPFLLSGRNDRDARYENKVFVEANLEEFIRSVSKAYIGTIYRPIFDRYLNIENITAQYLEGLRLAIKFDPSYDSIALMRKAEEHVECAKFAVGVFFICSGKYEDGKRRLELIRDNIKRPDLVIRIGERFMRQLYDIGPRLLELYEETFDYLE